MKKIVKIIISILLLSVMVFSTIACGEKPSPDDSSNSGGGGGGTVVTPPEDDKDTDYYLVKNGVTDYKIVIPTLAQPAEKTASRELQLFFEEATGIKLPIITDTGVAFNANAPYLSIGNTSILQGSGVKVEYNELGRAGLKLVTKGRTVIMAGATADGSLYAAYEFLERSLNFEVYGTDEIYIDTNVTESKLKDFNVTEVPTFESRSVGLYTYSINKEFRNRMRQDLYDGGWITWSHSFFKILPKEQYYTAHPDWYSPKGDQLCVSNEEMIAEFTKNVIQKIKDNPTHSYIHLGQEDTGTYCTCGKCTEVASKYKYSGLMMHFVNKVADGVQAYIDEYEPGRVFYLATFGYQKTQEGPANYVNGEWVPIDDTVLPRPNVMIMLAPIYACGSHSHTAQCNAELETIFGSWMAVAKGQIMMWIYNKIFCDYFIPFNNFSTFVNYYEYLDEEIGTYSVYHQGNKETPAGGMEELKCYVQAKLMWDRTLNMEDLIDDFCEHYYRDAGVYYREYFDLVRMSYEKWGVEYGLHCYNSTSASQEVTSYNVNATKYWTEDLLTKMEGLFQKMMDSIEKYKTSDPELYTKLDSRIRKERLTVRYLYLRFYMDYIPYEKAVEWVNDFEEVCQMHGIDKWREIAGANMPALLEEWRTAISKK